jgi:hypothetical protein
MGRDDLGAKMPKAISLIAGSSLDSPALKFVSEAFDSVWRKVAGQFQSPSEKEAARLILASAILAVATNQTRDIGLLKQAGLRAMRLTYNLPSAARNGHSK